MPQHPGSRHARQRQQRQKKSPGLAKKEEQLRNIVLELKRLTNAGQRDSSQAVNLRNKGTDLRRDIRILRKETG
jgi:hypothetical protein